MPATRMPLLAIHTTVAQEADASRLADQAVHQRLAACVQIERIESVYAWQGAVQHEAEWRLLFKTTDARASALLAWLQTAHPYELPAIYSTEVRDATPAYAQWVVAQTQVAG